MAKKTKTPKISNRLLVTVPDGIAAFIRRLWILDIVTYYCCEGYDVPKGKSPYARKYEDRRAYVMMRDDANSREWLGMLVDKWNPTNFNTPQNFDIEIDEGPKDSGQGGRITVRFPRADIDRLSDMTDFMADERRRVAQNV